MSSTVIGQSIVISGEVEGNEDLIVQGTIQGKISLNSNLIVEPSGNIQADVSSQMVQINGALTGNITASEKVEIKEHGKMTGDIKAPRILIADGALDEDEAGVEILAGRLGVGGRQLRRLFQRHLDGFRVIGLTCQSNQVLAAIPAVAPNGPDGTARSGKDEVRQPRHLQFVQGQVLTRSGQRLDKGSEAVLGVLFHDGHRPSGLGSQDFRGRFEVVLDLTQRLEQMAQGLGCEPVPQVDPPEIAAGHAGGRLVDEAVDHRPATGDEVPKSDQGFEVRGSANTVRGRGSAVRGGDQGPG